MFDLKVVSKDRLLFEGTINRVRIEGEESDFEIMSFHADVAGILRKGMIVVDNKYMIVAKKGMVSFHNNKCVILVEELKRRRKKS